MALQTDRGNHDMTASMPISVKNESALLIKHSVVYGLGQTLSYAVSFILLPLYTRYLSPTDYGIKELVGLTTDIIAVLLATAISSSLSRFYYEFDDPADRDEVVSTSIIAISVTGLVAVPILSINARLFSRYILNSSDLYYLFVLSFISLFFQSLSQVGYLFLRIVRKSVLYVTVSICRLLLAVSLNIYFIVFLHQGVLGVFLSTLITSVVTTAVMIVPLLAKTGLSFSRTKFKEMLRFGLPLIPSQIGGFVVHLSDRYFLKAYTSIAEAGIYSLGYRFGTIPNDFISGPFNQTWLPRRFEVYRQPQSERVFGTIFSYFLFVMLYASFAISVLIRDVLKIMSTPQFWDAWKITPIIAIGITIYSCTNHFNMGLLIAKRTNYFAYINMTNGVFVLLLNVLLIKRYGIYGAAYATVIAFIFKVALTYYYSAKYYSLYFESLRIVKMVGTAGVLYFCCQYIYIASVGIDLGVKCLVIAMYPVILYALGVFTREEVLWVRGRIEAAWRAVVRII